MIKYIKTFPELDIDKSNAQNRPILKESKVAKDYEIMFELHDDEIQDDIISLVSHLDNKVLINRVYLELGGGGGLLWLNVTNQIQPVIQFVSLAIATAVITNIYNNAKDKIVNLFKKTLASLPNLPLCIKILGPKDSAMNFYFFTFFNEEEYLEAWKNIPQALKDNSFEDFQEKIFFYDPKQNKWFIEGIQYNQKETI